MGDLEVLMLTDYSCPVRIRRPNMSGEEYFSPRNVQVGPTDPAEFQDRAIEPERGLDSDGSLVCQANRSHLSDHQTQSGLEN